MNRTRTGSAGQYRRTKTPNSTGVTRHREEYGPANIAGLYAFLSAAVASGQMTPGDKQRRVMMGR